MDTTRKLASCNAALAKAADLLDEFRLLVDSCMVDFIVEDAFKTRLPPDLAEELLSLTDEEVAGMPRRMREGGWRDGRLEKLDQVMERLTGCTLEGLGVLDEWPETEDQDEDVEDARLRLLRNLDRIMGEKKMHEVIRFSRTIHTKCLNHDSSVDTFVDLGSGKGYLDQILASVLGCDVLGVDAAEINSHGAEKRSKNLEAKWEALFRRAEIRSRGEEPPSRGKHWKARRAAEANGEDDTESEENSHPVSRRGKLGIVTKFVDSRSDLPGILEETFGPEKAGRDFGIVGLHTCGDLAPSAIRTFLSNPRATILANVGCCYHHLGEEFYRNPNLSDKENDACNSNPGFPLSRALRGRLFQLGRNARMMSAQPAGRMAESGKLPSPSLLWRAALQVLFLRGGVGDRGRRRVGKLAAGCEDFSEYCARAFDKAGASRLPEEEVQEVFQDLSSRFGRRLNAFYQLRSLFAPVVEGAVLLDRLAFLLESGGVSRACLVRLFDPVVSPRCYAVFAWKKKGAESE